MPTESQTQPLASPKDNLLGICNALGEDFGFNPLWLRLVLGAAFIIQPVGVVTAYLALGLVVLVSRLAFPDPRQAKRATVVVEPARAPVQDRDGDEQVFAQAA